MTAARPGRSRRLVAVEGTRSEYVRTILEAAPPLSAEAKSRLRAILRPATAAA